MQEIENFNTGLALNPNANNINLNPSENINNKKIITQLLKNISESKVDDLKLNITNAYHEDAALKCFHPINNIKGVEEIFSKIWLPLKNSFNDLERRNCLVLGAFKIKYLYLQLVF